jgi:hypothetical protein
MALPTTNISLDDIHVKVGGSTGTTVSLNDADVRALTYPDSTYNEGASGILQGSETFVSMGEFRNGFETVLSPEGTWILAKSSLLDSDEWTLYIQNDETATNAAVSATTFCTITTKETSTHLEIWLDPDYDDSRLVQPADMSTPTDPGNSNAYKIWSYALPAGVSGFTSKLEATTTTHSGTAGITDAGTYSGVYHLSTVPWSLSNDRSCKRYTYAYAEEDGPGGGPTTDTEEHSLDCTITFSKWEYTITNSFRIWFKSYAESTFDASCFDANTLVQMADGSEKALHLIQLGESTRGGLVLGTHKFLGGYNAYSYKGVVMSGTHWVVEDGKVMDVQDSEWAIKVDNPKYWYTLSTTDNRIWVNDIEFYDEGCMDFTSLNKYAQALINEEPEEIKKWTEKSIELSHGLEQRYLGINK